MQATSDNLNGNDRDRTNMEYQQLKEEANRIANSTDYNSMNLLDNLLDGSLDGSHGVSDTQGASGSSGTDGIGEITNITDLVTNADGLSNPYGLTLHNDQISWSNSSTHKIQPSNLDGSNIIHWS